VKRRGHDGVMGAIQALDRKVSPNKIMVQASGNASVIDIDQLREAVTACPSLRMMLARADEVIE
jgi:hypothetical protein